MLYDYLRENYNDAEPIFFSDIPLNGRSKPELSVEFRLLCEDGKLFKYEKGIYYMPKKSLLSAAVGPNADMVARYKYISRNGRTDGYYAGNSLANKFGISTQVPRKPEIVSNNMTAKIREISIGKTTFIVRRPVTEVTNENVLILQLLEMIKIVDAYMDGGFTDAAEKITDYVTRHSIRKSDVDGYIRLFPVSIFKNYYELEMDHVFAQG